MIVSPLLPLHNSARVHPDRLGCLLRHALPLGHWRYHLVFTRRHHLNETGSAVAQWALDGRGDFDFV